MNQRRAQVKDNLFGIKGITEIDSTFRHIEDWIQNFQLVHGSVLGKIWVQGPLVTLGQAQATEGVTCVVRVGTLAWFIDHAPAVRVVIRRIDSLATDDHVFLESTHVKQRLLVLDTVPTNGLEGLVKQREQSPDPVCVAAVHEFVRATLEPSFGTHLSIDGPAQQPVQIDQVDPIQQEQGR